MAAEAKRAEGGRKVRVLLADDELHVRTYLRFMVTNMGFEVVGEAINGEDAVKQFRATKPDIVLLDLNMPIKTGEEALQEIVAEFPQARVMILSSSADRETVSTCLDLGASNFIRKDSSFEDIRDIILETLE